MKDRVMILENKVIELSFRSQSTDEKLDSISRDCQENTKKVGNVHDTVSRIDSNLSVLTERLSNAIEINSRMYALIDGLQEDTDQAKMTLAELCTRQDQLEGLVEKQSDRQWGIIKLIPAALITALIAAGVSTAINSFKTDHVAIKQTQIDKLKNQIDKLTNSNKLNPQ